MSGSTATPRETAAGRKVLDLLGKQLGLYRRLAQLADAQRKAIEIDDTQPLLRLLSERRRLTAALTEQNAMLTPYRDHWDDLRTALAPADRRVMDETLAEASRCLQTILERDEADGRLLAAKKARTAQRMGELDTARRTLAAYGGTSGPAAGGSTILDGTEA